MLPIRRRLYQSLAGFSPRQLFAALQGAWLEPTPGYIFTDTAGSSAITTGGQAIARINDQSGYGYNASQSTAANRPLLGRRYNMLTWSEDFSNVAWTKSGVRAFGSGSVANTTNTSDPFGGYTAEYIQEDTSSGLHRVYQTATLVVGTSYQWSIYAKAAERSWIVIDSTDTLNRLTWFNLSNGLAGTVDSTRSASIQSAGNGWYKCTVTGTIASSSNCYLQAYLATGNNVSSYVGDGASGIYICGADLRLTADVGKDPTYQRITTATDYDYGQYPAAVHDATDSLVVSLPNLGGGVFSNAGSVYFATPVGMSALHNQSMGTSYTIPELSTDIYSWVVVPQRLNAAQENRLARYMERKAGIAGPDYLLDDDGNQLMSDNYELLLRQ